MKKTKKNKLQLKTPKTIKYGIIIGSGDFDYEQHKHDEKSLETPYGRIMVDILDYEGIEIALIARHGHNIHYPPHQTNYRGNIEAMDRLGVEYILATCSLTSINPHISPGECVLLEDFVDFTKARFYTFHQDGAQPAHVDMNEPYCAHLRQALKNQADASLQCPEKEIICVAMEGPREETRAEARFFQKMNWDATSMTTVPEVILAKEKGMCYASVGIITLQGKSTVTNPIALQENVLNARRSQIIKLFLRTFKDEPLTHDACTCRQALCYYK